MKSRIVKEIKNKYNIYRISGKKLESYNFSMLCFYLSQLEKGEEIK